MIAKLFKRFSLFSLSLSLSMLCLLSYIFSIPENNYFAFEDRIFNFLGIFVLTTLILHSLNRIFKYSKIENRSHYYLFLFPIILFSFPIEIFDIRVLASCTLFFSGWASFREYVDSKNSISSKNTITKLLDSVLLVTFSCVLFYENIVLLLFIILGLAFSKKNIKRQELALIVLVPVIILFTCFQLLLAFNVDFLLSSLLSDYHFTFSNSYNISFVYSKIDLLIIVILFIISVFIVFNKKSDYDSKTLDYDGLLYSGLILLIIGFSTNSSSMLLYYLSLPFTYYINVLFSLYKKRFLANFLIILLTISFLLFNFAVN